jgi:hypothetical protein
LIGLLLTRENGENAARELLRVRKGIGSKDRHLPADPLARQICASLASSTYDRPEMWTPAHAINVGARQSVAGMFVDEKNRCL